ncbi:MAG TPA: CHASE3 domain-containing protein [Bryobacteraceae bacterium]|nr:CHASE3 domain-containing protein [Bryobacteraceae bacterium]
MTPIHQKLIHQKTRWALLLIVPVLIGVVMYFFARRAKEENESVRHTLVVQLTLERLLFCLDHAETSERAFLLTGEDRLLGPYQEAVPQARRELASLRSLTVDNPRQQLAVLRIVPLIEQKLAHMEENIALSRGTGLKGEELVQRIDRGELLMDSIQGVAAELQTQEDRLLKQREVEFGEGASRFTWSVALGYLVLVVAAGSLYQAVKRYSRQAAEAEQSLSHLNSLLEQRVRARTASLQASEELLKTFVQHVPAAVAMLDRQMRYLQVSERWVSDFSLPNEGLLGRSHYEVFPDLPERWKSILQRCLAGESLKAGEDCFERADGSQIWLRWEVRPWGSRDGKPEGILIFSEDISAHKRLEQALRGSEQELRDLARSLLTAQADERRRIARDLHDDVTQRLALLSIEIGKLTAEEGCTGEPRRVLVSLQNQANQISVDVRRISHGLHPSVIEDFGLSMALEEFCDEFSKAQGSPVWFEGGIDEEGLSTEAASSLFRIAQEAVQNAAKHAGASLVHVVLRQEQGNIQLIVSDDGAGFSADRDQLNQGLGILSMKERIRMVNGTLTIHSQPGGGVQIVASVPFSKNSYETANSPG